MAMVTEGSLSIVVRSWTFMIIFCFAGCAAGSCLSYGHACWGAHGKRSPHQASNVHLMSTKSMDSDVQQDTSMPFGNKEQWIMSRLIDGRRLAPLLDKYSERWDTLRKERTSTHRHWNDAQTNGRKRYTDDNDMNENDRSEKEEEETAGFPRNTKEERNETPEIILISRSTYKERDNKPEDLDFFKLLAKDSEDFK